jgi:hypothetical protein
MTKGTNKFCICYVCGKSNMDVDFHEQYSFESGMCVPCNVQYQLWSITEGVDPSTGETFPERKEPIQ